MAAEVNAKGFAELIGVAPSTVANAIRAGRIKSRKSADGTVWIEPVSAYRDWFDSINVSGLRGRPPKPVDQDEFRRRLGDMAENEVQAPRPEPDGDSDEPEDDDQKSLAYWQKLKMRHQARKAEVEADLAEQSVVPKAEVQQEWVRTAKIVLTKLMGLPGKCKARLPHLSTEDMQVIDEFVREACEELSNENGPVAADAGEDD